MTHSFPTRRSSVLYLGLHHPGPVPLLPADPRAALEVRGIDRYFDNYISTPQQKVVFDSLRPEADRDARGVADARAMLDTAYAWLDRHMRSEEHTSELQSLMRISYAVFCLTK